MTVATNTDKKQLEAGTLRVKPSGSKYHNYGFNLANIEEPKL